MDGPIADLQGTRGTTIHEIVPNSFDFYSHSFWNSYPCAVGELSRRVSGDPGTGWYVHFQRTVARCFRKALILNCGHGWVERDLLAVGMFREAVAVDFAEPLLTEARREAEGLPIRYYRMDINKTDFPERDFDLVVNCAAGHHIAYLNRVYRTLCDMLSPDGYFLNYDYVGPHRFQWPYAHWSAAWEVNESLPPNVRNDLKYPHLPTMRVVDPTEAVHSELIHEITRRYFDVVEQHHLGGAIAYPVLLDNANMQRATAEEQERWVTAIMDADARFLAENPGASYFDYFVCTPKKEVLERPTLLAEWDRCELAREDAARANGSTYYPRQLLQRLTEDLADQRMYVQHGAASISELHRELAAVSTSRSWQWTQPLRNAYALGRHVTNRLRGLRNPRG